jgi:ferredoxin-NADP reductase/predicted pyridoxine 5'-phosphate oxidase superfamily flavin-nucleotide-binding protein
MGHQFAEIAFTPVIRDIQIARGSRKAYAGMDQGDDYNHILGEREASFIAARDSFYMASVSESGWPYVQHRGGPAGFMKVLGERTIGFADYSGNRQYVSTGNLSSDDRVSLFFMDYPNRRRLKMLGRVRVIDPQDPGFPPELIDEDYTVQVERGFIIDVEAFDWNCPQHITPRFSEAEIESLVSGLREENRKLKAAQPLTNNEALLTTAPATGTEPAALGEGPLALVVSGVRQLAPRVRAFELRDPSGGDLPPVEPGSHLRVPVRLPTGELVDRHYSIASNPARRDAFEIAVLREDEGLGGSAAVHDSYHIDTALRIDLPGNHFPLHDDQRPAVLIAGGIGITPIKAMSQSLSQRGNDFHLHYAGRSHPEMAYRDRLERELGDQLSIYSAADGERMDIQAVLRAAAADAVIYVCGPERLVNAVLKTAKEQGIEPDRIRLELFS